VGSRSAGGGFLQFKEAPAKLVEAREHGKAVLECSAAGSPPPSLTWYKDGEPIVKLPEVMFYPGGLDLQGSIPEDQDKALAVAHAKLELDCVTAKDAGFYQCVASQGPKTESVGTEVHVVSESTVFLDLLDLLQMLTGSYTLEQVFRKT
jgi:hypothetical protein